MLKVSHICKTFTGGIIWIVPSISMVPESGLIRKTRVDAVKDVSFTICNGETFGIVGNSGCGKSTIANMLLSLIKPDSGTIEIDGTIQIIFQHPETSLDPAKKIGYSLEEPMIIHKMYDKAGRKKRVKELLDRVDLGEELLDRYPHQISGGEAQRIMIWACTETSSILVGTADHDRQGSLPGSKDPDLRRANEYARRLRTGPDHDTLKGAPGKTGSQLPVHLPRPRCGPLVLR